MKQSLRDLMFEEGKAMIQDRRWGDLKWYMDREIHGLDRAGTLSQIQKLAQANNIDRAIKLWRVVTDNTQSHGGAVFWKVFSMTIIAMFVGAMFGGLAYFIRLFL